MDEKLREEGEEHKRYDQPDLAEEFALKKRLPQGERSLPYQRYVDARSHANRMPVADGAAREIFPAGRAPTAVTWTEKGPGNIGGRTRAIAFDPVTPNTMYVGGVAGGVFKSTDGGNSWAPIGDLMANLAVSQIVVDRTNGNRIWAGTGEGMFNVDAQRGAGIFLSTDGGATWNQLASTNVTNFQRVNDLIQSPNDANTLYAATRIGVFVSTDSGTSWTAFTETQGHVGGCFDLSARPGSGPADTVLAACGSFYSASFAKPTSALYRNTNARGGGTFAAVIAAAAGQARASVSYAPSDNTYAYAVFACSSSGAVACGSFEDGVYKVFRSIDGGATWTTRFTNDFSANFNPPGYQWGNLIFSNPVSAINGSIYGQGWYDNTLAVHPTNRDQIFAGGIDLFRSDDGGATWGGLSYWWLDPVADEQYYAHADHHKYIFHPGYNGTTETRFFIGNDGGIQQASDAHTAVRAQSKTAFNPSVYGDLRSATWNNQNLSLGITQFYHGDIYPNGTTYFGGTQDNGTNRGTDAAGLNGWTEILGGDGGYVAVNPSNTNQLFAENYDISIQRSDDGGATWANKITGITDSFQFINPFVMDPNTATRLWTGGQRLWRTANSGDSWTAASASVNAACAGQIFSAHAIAPGNSDRALSGTDCGFIYRSSSATTTVGTTVWSGVQPRTGYVSSFAFDPANSLIAYATYATFTGSHVWKTTDGGATWSAIDGVGVNALPDIPAHSVLVDPRSASTLWVGTDLGVFVTLDGGANWARENTGFANVFTEHLDLHQVDASNWKLYAFTHGRGVFATTLTSTPNTAPTITGPSNQNINEDANTGALAVTVGDAETAVASLSLSGTSSNTTLVPNNVANISFGGSGANRTVTITPAANQSGVTTITLRVTDGGGLFTETSFTVTVAAVDDPPVAVNDSATVNEDSGANTIAVLTNDTDVDGGTKLVTAVGTASNGATAVGPAGANATYTPNANYCGPDSFTYTITGGSNATVTVTVTCVDDAPVAVADSSTVNEDSGANTITVLANDTDIDGGTKLVTAVGAATNGTTAVGPAGANATYTPNANYCGPDSFTYTITGGSSATVTVTVTCVDDAPVAVADSATVNEDSGANSITVLTNDTDIDGGTKLVTAVGAATNGTTAVGPAGANATYTPNANYCGPDSFTYTITGGSSATVSVTVTCVDDGPATAVNDSPTVNEDSGANAVSVLSNDTPDPDGTAFVVTAVGLATNGSTAVGPGGANATYTPNANYCGPDSFTYTITGGSSATVTVTVTCVDDAPVAVADSATVNEDSGANSITVLTNDTDIDGGTKLVTAVGAATNGTTAVGPAGANATYTPSANYCGPDSFTYTITGGSSATVTVTVTCVDDAPMAVADSATVNEDSGANTIAVLTNDTDVDGGTKLVTSVGTATNGTTAVGPAGANATYAPNANYCGPDSFTYTITGGSSATVTVTVTCVDDAPVAVADSATVNEDSGANTIAVLTNDTDIDGGTKLVTAVGAATNGTTAVGPAGANATYAPNANYCGPDSFTYTITGGSSATVTVTVTCVDDAPVAVADSSTVNEDSGANTITVLANDTDIDGGTKLVTAVGAAANGTTAVGPAGANATYTPNANYCGPDSFTYTITGGSSATVSVTVTCVDDNPVAVADSSTVNEDSGANTITVLANDTDIDGGTKLVTAVGAAANGTTAVGPAGANATYTPNANYCGPDSFTYTITGGSTATVTVTVTCVDDAPVAVADSGTVNEDSGANTIAVLTNDTDIDGGTKLVTAVGAATNGTTAVGPAGANATYTPNANYCGPDSFTYTITGGSTATVTVTVTCVDDAPAAVADSATVNEDSGAKSITVLTNDTDVDGGTKLVTAVGAATNGTTAVGPAGANATYTPNANYCGPDSFTYTITGGSSATVSVTVTCVNDAPTAVGSVANVSGPETLLLSITTASAFNDVDSASLTYSASGLPAWLTINPGTGVISGTPPIGASVPGTYPITVTASDAEPLSANQSFTVTVLPVGLFADGFETPPPPRAAD
ncbi:MAG: tandem-95 repeat protein [Xanthomonadales bacterium]|nr:tandem-95 repeat protein [Xanthomonadales bacterium]